MYRFSDKQAEPGCGAANQQGMGTVGAVRISPPKRRAFACVLGEIGAAAYRR
jgi:hypothetical protein